jgi:hypothetical protein
VSQRLRRGDDGLQQQGGGLLSCALIDPNGIATPKDLVTCRIGAARQWAPVTSPSR